MWRCMHILRPLAATSQPLPHRLCFPSPTLPASTLAPHKFSSLYFSGLRPPFPVGASPCRIPRYVNHRTYLAAISRDRPGFVRRCLLPRPPALRGFTLGIFRDLRHPFFCGGITLKCLHKSLNICIYITSVRDHFAAAIASTSLSPTVPASVCICIYITYVRDHFCSPYRLDFVAGGASFPPLLRAQEKNKIHAGIYM